MNGVTGFAVRLDGKIVVETIGPHERAAKANGLLVLFGIMPQHFWTDDHIARSWADCLADDRVAALNREIEIVPVAIVAGDRAYTQAEIDAVLKAAFPAP